MSLALARAAQRLDGGGDRRCLGVADLEVGLERSLASVLEGHLCRDLCALAAGIECVDERPEPLGDEAPTHLARAGELAVIGVELLVQDQEAMDLRACERRLLRQVAIYLLDATRNEIVDRIEARELLITAIGDAVPLGPVADCLGIDIDESGHVGPPRRE